LNAFLKQVFADVCVNLKFIFKKNHASLLFIKFIKLNHLHSTDKADQ